MRNLISNLNLITEWTGKIFAWSTLLMVILICIDVILRYLFNFTLIWIIELEIYFFAITFLMASGYAFKYDKHVRVDVFYTKFSPKKKAWTNLIGGLFLLLPWAVISTYVCFNYFLKSWYINETSAQPGGLPAIYVLKFILFLGFLMLSIQAIADILESFQTIREAPKVNSDKPI
ncbi:MAG: TRAP transporter small permease subunit [Bacteroidia bacterium]|nr:TRAP transporter small permease subunit [Bacteroidia bacterium]